MHVSIKFLLKVNWVVMVNVSCFLHNGFLIINLDNRVKIVVLLNCQFILPQNVFVFSYR